MLTPVHALCPRCGLYVLLHARTLVLPDGREALDEEPISAALRLHLRYGCG
jgi:hypothetical protein